MKPKPRGQAISPSSTPVAAPLPSTLSPPAISNGQQMDSSLDSPPLEPNTSPNDTIGQFSYGPATQTTVVTTTTTTTTKFPPLVLRAPRHLKELDPKLYPLAASPTPRSIRKLVFEVDGQPTTFQEADDTLQTVEQLRKQKKALAQSHGSLQSVRNISGPLGGPHVKSSANPSRTSSTSNRPLGSFQRAGTKRSASPVSISEAARLAAQDGPRKRRLIAAEDRTAPSSNDRVSRTLQPHLQKLQTSTPMSPDLGANAITQLQQTPEWDTQIPRPLDMEVQRSAASSSTFENGGFENEAQILSPKSDDGRSEADETAFDRQSYSFADSDLSSFRSTQSSRAMMTPGMERNSVQAHHNPHRRSFREPSRVQCWPRPQALDTTATQDASLPSPSLSPITASTTLEGRLSHTKSRLPNSRQKRSTDAQLSRQREYDQNALKITNVERATSTPQAQWISDSAKREQHLTPREDVDRSLMCIPQLVDDFEAMPEEIKQYVIYQLLRRSSKPVLHFVAGVVNPALKVDFFKHLPLELSEVILGHLDIKSLSSAAQVSKRWRQSVDMSEKVWKRLFYANGYTLQEGELARAIREGWGYQTVSNPREAEQDLSLLVAASSDIESSTVVSLQDSAHQPHRSKRKGKAKGKSASKPSRRRKQVPLFDSPDIDENAFLIVKSATDGPYAAASAAAAAISLPHSNVHLWKSIYMRHHIIRKTWLQDEVAPRHIAFRAHQRHVVTCLQFDSEKILTGSDDANINVYDTQTGALRAKLEGHEGGVWALQYEGNVLVSGSTDRSVRVWDIERGICTHTFQGHTSTVRCLQILLPPPDGRGMDGRPVLLPKTPLVITGSRDSHLRVWKLPKPGDEHHHQAGPAQDESTECPFYVRTLTGHHHSVRAIAAYGDTLVSGSYDCSVRVWRISTGETMHRLQGHSQKVYSVVLDTKRNRCISGSMDNVVKVWSLETGMSLFNLEGHSSLVGLLDLQQDRLVSAAADSTLRIWDPENGQCKSTLSAHTGAITCFQHDGQKVISGSDRTLKMWNVASGGFVKDLLTDLSGVWQVKFNERRCVAAVQRNNFTFIEVLDFGAARDGVSEHKRGKRILVDAEGREIIDPHDTNLEVDFMDAN
ncbi:uncharacterized protein KY384_004370 [Bacidia gigantensis]|uniref:uncharacterized protein n=1 Tax=Bacidia gigantensis TaxID=2732470 RepID=UPI001D05A34C|nr:uncharacterized protein KY384_004370 [Bacidia gigantensis]KAG8531013.1 hypothetical protein KY384_004370 [Bacidia gigantensis]